MKKKITVLTLCTVLFALCSSAEAQQLTKIPRIGFLSTLSAVDLAPRMDAFRHGLQEFGYREGKSIVIEQRFADGKLERLPTLATELIHVGVDTIVTSGPAATAAAKKATTTVPIVMAFDDDPVGIGLIASLSRPGGNITGLSTLSPEISGKQLELLKEIFPKLSRVAVLGTSTRPGTAETLKETESAASVLGVQLQYLELQNSKDIETAFREAKKGRAEGLLVLPGVLISYRNQLVGLAAKNRIPAIYSRPEYVEAGGLMMYGVNISDLFRRAATYVDKILKGSKPADLPVEQPKKFEFVINLKAAKQIGLTIPPNVLARADKVIK